MHPAAEHACLGELICTMSSVHMHQLKWYQACVWVSTESWCAKLPFCGTMTVKGLQSLVSCILLTQCLRFVYIFTVMHQAFAVVCLVPTQGSQHYVYWLLHVVPPAKCTLGTAPSTLHVTTVRFKSYSHVILAADSTHVTQQCHTTEPFQS